MPSWYLPENAKERLLKYEYRGVDYSYVYKYMWRPLCANTVKYVPVWLAANTITVTALALTIATHVLVAYYMPKLTVKDTDYIFRSELKRTALPYAKEFLPPPPGYVFVLAGLVLLAYQYLDNLDGHQARRTGTSGPLGLLMDHGCDAINCVVGALTAASALSCGPCWKTWALVINTCSLFVFNTWEEYYRGILVLPVINGPNEGILMNVAAFFWTATVGPQWWSNNAIEIPTRFIPSPLRQPAPAAAVAIERTVLDALCPVLTRHPDDSLAPLPLFFGVNCTSAYRADPPLPTPLGLSNVTRDGRIEMNVLGKRWQGNSVLQNSVLRLYGANEDTLRIKYNTIMVLAVVAMGVATMLGNVLQVYLALRRMPLEQRVAHYGGSWLQRRFPFVHALTRIAPLIAIMVLCNVWFAVSEDDIFRANPRIFCWTVGLLFVKISIHIMVAHLCSTDFQAFRRTFIPFVLFGVHLILSYVRTVQKRHARDKKLQRAAANGLAVPAPDTEEHASLVYIDETLLVYEFFALSLITFVHLVYSVVIGIARELDVFIFTVPKEKQLALLNKIADEKKKKKQ